MKEQGPQNRDMGRLCGSREAACAACAACAAAAGEVGAASHRYNCLRAGGMRGAMRQVAKELGGQKGRATASEPSIHGTLPRQPQGASQGPPPVGPPTRVRAIPARGLGVCKTQLAALEIASRGRLFDINNVQISTTRRRIGLILLWHKSSTALEYEQTWPSWAKKAAKLVDESSRLRSPPLICCR